MALPTPIGRQKEVLYLPAEGHVVVLGTAGSGKTTLAILRAAYLANPQTDHHGKTLLVTFNRALVSYLKYLQDRRLTNVLVENYHKFARGYLAGRRKMSPNTICDPDRSRMLVAQAVREVSTRYPSLPLLNRPVELFSEEFRWMAQHGILTLDVYNNAERVGRAARIERRSRPVVFEIYDTYRRLREQIGKKYDWDDLATAVCIEFGSDTSPRRYRHIVIDEGQDFSPEMLRSLARAIPSDGSLTFFGDVAQQIYGHRMSWRSAGLNVSKVWEFKENYRNSRQVAQLGLAIARMPYFKDLPDIVEPVSPTADGPLPTLVACSSVGEEVKFVVSQAMNASRTRNVAILLRNRQDEALFTSQLPKDCIRLHRDMTTWQAGPGIRYGTYHSAKGLEFDVVILPFCGKDRLPDPEGIATFGEEDAAIQDGRLLYVGVTRAKTNLILTYCREVTSLLPNRPGLYERVQR
jgi:superfamily I DNA/RNA helicase